MVITELKLDPLAVATQLYRNSVNPQPQFPTLSLKRTDPEDATGRQEPPTQEISPEVIASRTKEIEEKYRAAILQINEITEKRRTTETHSLVHPENDLTKIKAIIDAIAAEHKNMKLTQENFSLPSTFSVTELAHQSDKLPKKVLDERRARNSKILRSIHNRLVSW